MNNNNEKHGETDAAQVLLRLRGITKRYGAQTVLDGIDLDLTDNAFVCLLGPSGCGKTTLLRILCGIEPDHSGRVFMGEHDITTWPAAQRRFGVVFQSYALFPNLTAMGNVAYGLRGMDRDHMEQHCRDMLDLVGLAAHAGKYPAQLSGGQQQRVALARALAPKPRLLLLDEPLSALDAQVRVGLRHELRRLQRHLRIPTVMVTHDQDEALGLADRVVLMDHGHIVQDSQPMALYTAPASEFAARFVGRMNVWDGLCIAPGVVQVGQGQLRVAGAMATGRTLKLGIRPELVSLSERDWASERTPNRRAQDASHSDNQVPVQLTEISFSGAYVGLRLSAPELGLGLDAELPTPLGGQLPWAVGERLMAHLPAHALSVLSHG
jgi:iron(III) transport system ATP-binding protein